MTTPGKRLLVIGAGSSGIVTLRTAIAALPDWEIVCFEKSGDIVGCWGKPYPGFVSTTTRYATQFAAMAYFADDETVRNRIKTTPVFLPTLLIAILLLLKPVDWIYRFFHPKVA